MSSGGLRLRSSEREQWNWTFDDWCGSGFPDDPRELDEQAVDLLRALMDALEDPESGMSVRESVATADRHMWGRVGGNPVPSEVAAHRILRLLGEQEGQGE